MQEDNYLSARLDFYMKMFHFPPWLLISLCRNIEWGPGEKSRQKKSPSIVTYSVIFWDGKALITVISSRSHPGCSPRYARAFRISSWDSQLITSGKKPIGYLGSRSLFFLEATPEVSRSELKHEGRSKAFRWSCWCQKCWKRYVLLQKSVPMQPNTDQILPKCWHSCACSLTRLKSYYAESISYFAKSMTESCSQSNDALFGMWRNTWGICNNNICSEWKLTKSK